MSSLRRQLYTVSLSTKILIIWWWFFFSFVFLSFFLLLIVDTIQRRNSEPEGSERTHTHTHIHIHSERWLCFLLLSSISFFKYNISLSIPWMCNNVPYNRKCTSMILLFFSPQWFEIYSESNRVYVYLWCISWKWMTIWCVSDRRVYS